MGLLTVSNLYPRPDQLQRGLFNSQLFGKLHAKWSAKGRTTQNDSQGRNLVLVPEFRAWRWPIIRRWKDPSGDTAVNTTYVPAFYLPVVGRSLSAWTYGLALKGFCGDFERADAVLASWLYPDAVAAARLASRLGKPAWAQALGSDRFHLATCRRRAVSELNRTACGIVVSSRFLADELARDGIERSLLRMIPVGVDLELFRPRPKAESWGFLRSSCGALATELEAFTLNAKLVVFVGNLVDVKGPDVLLSAWTEVLKRARGSMGESATSDWPMLLVIGDGPMRQWLAAEAERLGIAHRVRFLGSRPHYEVARWMNVSACLCLTSRSESMPNVVLEAMASGTPVVATDAGDVPLAVDNGVSGFVVRRDEPDLGSGIADGIERVLASAWDCGRIRKRVEGYTWENAAEALLKLMTAERT